MSEYSMMSLSLLMSIVLTIVMAVNNTGLAILMLIPALPLLPYIIGYKIDEYMDS